MTAIKAEAVTSRKGAHHQSSLETILDGCSWQYYLTNILEKNTPPKPHSVAGTTFHSAIELHEEARLNNKHLPSLEDMLSFIDTTIREIAPNIMPEMMQDKDGKTWDADTLIGMSQHALRNWYSEPLKDGGISHRDWLMELTPIAIEPYFKHQLVEGALPIAGWMDGIYMDKAGKFLIVDQKTVGDFSRWQPDGRKHRNQATMYAVALILNPAYPTINNIEDVAMHYLVSRTRDGNVERCRRIIVQPDLDDVKVLGDRIRAAENIIKEDLFVPNPSWNLCSPRFCSFYKECQIDKTLNKKDLNAK